VAEPRRSAGRSRIRLCAGAERDLLYPTAKRWKVRPYRRARRPPRVSASMQIQVIPPESDPKRRSPARPVSPNSALTFERRCFSLSDCWATPSIYNGVGSSSSHLKTFRAAAAASLASRLAGFCQRCAIRFRSWKRFSMPLNKSRCSFFRDQPSAAAMALSNSAAAAKDQSRGFREVRRSSGEYSMLSSPARSVSP
jgi:hypothetical protein